ncbi:hypothetical protein DPMN_104827 [Dreissena polymorpha]|uniref:Uncharacterized protein n=1 Tax=Dreissena polymorpha TaxID=45954 RepID=A0A9D4HG34_DREPO|nr:hypothetical protein DPMN_104827 [Dreissena polymorpha]
MLTRASGSRRARDHRVAPRVLCLHAQEPRDLYVRHDQSAAYCLGNCIQLCHLTGYHGMSRGQSRGRPHRQVCSPHWGHREHGRNGAL